MSSNITDTFQFDCRMCGVCCREDREIVLNPYDVFVLARHFGMGTAEMLDRWCRVERETGMGVPLAMLRTEGGACVFLEDDRCVIHRVRPACCRNYPLGALFDADGAVRHVMVDPEGCPGVGTGTLRTVEQWHAKSGVSAAMPGIELLRLAAAAPRYKLTHGERDALLRILYDFDSLLDADGRPANRWNAARAMEFLSHRIVALFALAYPRPR